MKSGRRLSPRKPNFLLTSDILFDSWALTTIRAKLPARPFIEPYLHGLSEWEAPETYVAWREEVDIITGGLLDRYKPEDLLEDYPLKPHELLRDRSDRVFDNLQTIKKRINDDVSVWLEQESGQVYPTTLGKLLGADRNTVINRIAHCRVLLPPSAGGLTDHGTLDGMRDFNPDHEVGYDIADDWFADEAKAIRRRIRIRSDDPRRVPPKGMRLARPSLDTNPSDHDELTELIGSRFWHWYKLPKGADDEGSKFAQEPVTWDAHTDQVTKGVMQIAVSLRLPDQLQDVLKLAAKFHDLGKKREVWQRNIGNPNPTDWHAKSGRDTVTGKLWKPCDICPDYRHEFGSLLDVESKSEFTALKPDMKDLVLHLIAAHHGRGRPHFPANEAFDQNATEEDAAKLAAKVPRRFSLLQRKYGRWGLAYIESLLRAADYAASSNPD